MKIDHRNKILDYYNSKIELYGNNSHQTLGYVSAENQVIRYMVLNDFGEIENKHILDLGCGFGDFSYFLKKKEIEFTYTGLDLNPSFIQKAKEKYPTLNFQVSSLFDYQGADPDVIFASGIFGLLLDTELNSRAYMLNTVKEMYKRSKRGIAFNLLNKQGHPAEKNICTFDVHDIHKELEKITTKLTIRQDYLVHDFTIYMYK